MNESFINKYKKEKLDELYLNNNTKKLIKDVIKKRNINLLFIGGSETGKTSLINTLNNVINGGILINNLKEKGINTFRTDVKLYCQLTQKKKTILIDDYDHITENCQHVIKTLMDKYNNILFIASIKDIKKLIEPLKNKFFLIKLDNITNNFIYQNVVKLLKNENLKLNKNCINHVVEISNLSLNRMYNNIEKIKLLDKKIKLKECINILTNINYNIFNNIINTCLKGDTKEVYILFDSLYIKGYSIIDIYEYFYKYIKNTKNIPDDLRYKIIILLCEYISKCDSTNELDIQLLLFSKELVSILNSTSSS